MKDREHLKNLLVIKGLAQTPDEAERMVLAAQVKVDGATMTQAGALVAADAQLEVQDARRYVSRGGFKLEGALDDFSFDVAGLSCIDVGASSGGFSDCLLQRGALQVTAVDVGYGQFDWKLRKDSRVTLFERANIAKADPASLGAPFDLLVADLSFTSLARLAPQFTRLIKNEGDCLALVKPQFELPKDLVFDGVIRNPDLHVEAIQRVVTAFEIEGLTVLGLSYSPIIGPKGNKEFWIWAAKGGATATIYAKETQAIEEVVRLAHEQLSD